MILIILLIIASLYHNLIQLYFYKYPLLSFNYTVFITIFHSQLSSNSAYRKIPPNLSLREHKTQFNFYLKSFTCHLPRGWHQFISSLSSQRTPHEPFEGTYPLAESLKFYIPVHLKSQDHELKCLDHKKHKL